jgi:hypothetical protein
MSLASPLVEVHMLALSVRLTAVRLANFRDDTRPRGDATARGTMRPSPAPEHSSSHRRRLAAWTVRSARLTFTRL